MLSKVLYNKQSEWHLNYDEIILKLLTSTLTPTSERILSVSFLYLQVQFKIYEKLLDNLYFSIAFCIIFLKQGVKTLILTNV